MPTFFMALRQKKRKALLNLISVSGIGPVSALAIIAADDNAGLVQAIESKNITYLDQVSEDRQENSPTDGLGSRR